MMQKWRFFLFNLFILSAVGLAVIISSPVQATIVSGDIVSFWTLDESNTPYTDSIGANDGADAAAGAPTPTSGQVNGAQGFTRDNVAGTAGDGIDIACNNCDLDWGATASFSIEFWMKGTLATTGINGYEVMFGRNEGDNQPQWWIGINPGQKVACLFVDSDGGGGFSELETSLDPADVLDGNWHHIVCVRDFGDRAIRLYVDTVVTEASETFDSGFESTADLNLGYMFGASGEYHFSGALDEVAIYNRALTATEVQELFTAQGGPRYFLQSDTDGISDGEENAGPNNGDGDNDGTADMNQDTVASLLSNNGTDYVTIKTSAGTLASCAAVANPSAGDAPSNTNFPWGFLEFTIDGAASSTVTLYLPAGAAPETYYKYGPPTPGAGASEWYEFLNDGTTGATFNNNVVTLLFVEGDRGDDTVGGSIVDQGGPATVTSTPVGGGGGGGGCFIATAAYGSLMEPHVKILRDFRDRFLLENHIGKAFVNLYYKHSPPIANFISKHANWRGLVRISLLPVVGISWAALKLGPLPTALMFFFSICLIGATILREKKVKK